MGAEMKVVPRWAVGNGLIKVLQYQQENVDWQVEPFGKLKPSLVK